MMFLNKIIMVNKVLILGFFISNCNSTEQNIHLKYDINKLNKNNIYSHDTLKKFYKKESEEIQDNINSHLEQKLNFDLITQVQNSQNQLINVINEVINKIHCSKNNIIQLLEESNNTLQKNIMKNTGVRYIIDLINQLLNEFHDNITNPIIKLIDAKTKLIIDNNKDNVINDVDDILCNKICYKLGNDITKLLQLKKKNPGILKNKFNNRKDRKLAICSENCISILSNKKKKNNKKKELINYDAIFDHEYTNELHNKNSLPKKHRIKVKRKVKNNIIKDSYDDIFWHAQSKNNSFHNSNISDSTQSQSQIQNKKNTLDENTITQLRQILKNNDNLYKSINELKFLLELNQSEITQRLNNSNNNTYNTLKENIKNNKKLIIDAINKSTNDIIDSVKNNIHTKINNDTQLIIDSCNNTINKNYEKYYDTISTSKPVISEIVNNIIDKKLLPTINAIDTKYNAIDMKYNEIINNYKYIYEEKNNGIIQYNKVKSSVIQEVKTELQNINNNIKASTEKVLLSLSYFGKNNNIANDKFKNLFNFFNRNKS